MMKSAKFLRLFAVSIALLAVQNASAMHISEGFLPPQWCLVWYLVSLPFIAWGLNRLRKTISADPKSKLILGICGAFVFVLSAIKLPSVTGSSSHLVGTSLGAMITGPAAMAVVGVVVLLFQALLLAHGGLTTLGANVFSMAIAGPFLAYGLFCLGKKVRWNESVNIFFASFVGSLFTYVVTSFQLAVSFPDATGGWWVSFLKFGALFAVTQLPLSVIEGFLTLFVYRFVSKHIPEISFVKTGE
ncbi:energy-coupling factor ABC transporter permease [Parabacteroides sp. FAFU027]|uniref:energy-coupling factor ABC transporter permease n=1 Tax=Parabacteroides sp. FAFU027 TaxID=2922715 RepID=UPI001FAF5B82|nr:energy-coupling factor ABC transporter permease [Parabacteroides sp. FAFU027]